jgi:hypothetical protein
MGSAFLFSIKLTYLQIYWRNWNLNLFLFAKRSGLKKLSISLYRRLLNQDRNRLGEACQNSRYHFRSIFTFWNNSIQKLCFHKNFETFSITSRPTFYPAKIDLQVSIEILVSVSRDPPYLVFAITMINWIISTMFCLLSIRNIVNVLTLQFYSVTPFTNLNCRILIYDKHSHILFIVCVWQMVKNKF